MLTGLARRISLADAGCLEIVLAKAKSATRSYAARLSEFRLDMAFADLALQIDDVVLEKRLYLPYRQKYSPYYLPLAFPSGKL